ncbi:MAG: 3-phosphoserine/phosphohydroxythreonine transaminase [Gammaproteobacteria bacterium]|nr:MAG: 3-phosphoserine/phosphohydroxythreonine transaminase [Gammaproteobacteria bacterium]
MFNFASGPGMWPGEVLEQARNEWFDWDGTGMSVLEMPFTSDEFKSIARRARDDLQALLGLPENYRILFMQGGAYAHFALLAMNLMGKNACADYVQTGHWSNRAIIEAKRYGQVTIAASSKATGFDCIPAQSGWHLNPAAAYCHITSNETANGVQFHWTPDTGAVPLVADVTSDFLAREIDISRYGMVYASAQKNIGPAGLTLVIIREDLLDQAMDITPAVFNYGFQAKNDSRVNTQPTYSLYLASLIFAWILRQGGVATLESLNRQKSRKLYDLIDADDFYFCPVAEADRSLVNVCFYLREPALEARFLENAEQAGLIHLKGHGAAGGIRASLYNAMPVAGVEALTGFMQSFADTWRDRAPRTTGTAAR